MLNLQSRIIHGTVTTTVFSTQETMAMNFMLVFEELYPFMNN